MGKNIKNLLAWIMMLMMMVNLIPFQMVVYAEEEETGTDVTDDLTDLVAVVSQGGAQIEENGTLTSTEPISIVISFGVPVEGDVPTPANPVQKGDFADFELSNAFTPVSYTHLDVYKRQDKEKTRLLEGRENVVYDYRGNVYCYCPLTGTRRAMTYGGFEQDRGCLLYTSRCV